jgi:Helix-turn-helix domain
MPDLSRHLTPRREKVFGPGPAIRLDGNAKARVWSFAQGWTAKHCQPGQHRGPITRAFMEILKTLLWGFHNNDTGRCFPSYETIAARARCNRDTVYEAIRIFEQADILTWVNRITRIKVQELDLFGHKAWRWQTIRTSNAYIFRDPLPCAPHREIYKSENPSGPLNQELSLEKQRPQIIILDPSNRLDASLIRLGTTIGALLPASVPCT